MNILNVIGSLDQRAGGPLRAVLDLSALSQSHGLHSEILGVGALSIVDNPLSAEMIHALPAMGPAAFQYTPSVRSWCRANLGDFDGVVLHGMWSYLNFIVSRQCIATGIPYVCFPHGMLDLWPVRGQGWVKRVKKTLYWHCIEKDIVKHSSGIFFTLHRELVNARKTFRLPAVRTFTVSPYGSGLTGIPGRASESGHPHSRKEKMALFLGRVHPKKRPDLLIEAWGAAKIQADWRLVIAGPGEPAYLNHLAETARRCGVESSIDFAGAVSGEQKLSLFGRASWFLLPSEQENFGIAVMEALCSGCATAISDQVYLADEFPEGSEILPVRLDAWTAFMRERMTDSKWREVTALRCQAKLLDRFNPALVGLAWANCLRQALGGRVRRTK